MGWMTSCYLSSNFGQGKDIYARGTSFYEEFNVPWLCFWSNFHSITGAIVDLIDENSVIANHVEKS